MGGTEKLKTVLLVYNLQDKEFIYSEEIDHSTLHLGPASSASVVTDENILYLFAPHDEVYYSNFTNIFNKMPLKWKKVEPTKFSLI